MNRFPTKLHVPEQRVLPIEARATVNDIEQNLTDTAELGQNAEAINDEANDCDNTETPAKVSSEWQTHNVAGSFILYAMLNKSQFLQPFVNNLKAAIWQAER